MKYSSFYTLLLSFARCWMPDKGHVPITKDGQGGGGEKHSSGTFLYLCRQSLCQKRCHGWRIISNAYFKREHSEVRADIIHQHGPTWHSSGLKGQSYLFWNENIETLLLMLEPQQSTSMHRSCISYPLQTCTKFAVTWMELQQLLKFLEGSVTWACHLTDALLFVHT